MKRENAVVPRQAGEKADTVMIILEVWRREASRCL